MPIRLSRRTFGAAATLAIAAPFVRRAWADEPLQLRCSLDTAPSHPRNFAFRDFLAKVEQASGGRVATKLFEAGSLFPDLQVTKALIQGQVEMACPGTWTLTGLVPDADFMGLPAFYGRTIETVHKATDGALAVVGGFIKPGARNADLAAVFDVMPAMEGMEVAALAAKSSTTRW